MITKSEAKLRIFLTIIDCYIFTIAVLFKKAFYKHQLRDTSHRSYKMIFPRFRPKHSTLEPQWF